MIIADLRLRTILDSRAERTVEAELTLSGPRGDATGRGSSARAIAPGRLEPRRGVHTGLGPAPLPRPLASLVGARTAGQRDFDAALDGWTRSGDLGSDVTVAVSLAHARALAADERRPLVRLLADQAGTVPAVPRLMVNLFSGGIHTPGSDGAAGADGFQQVMALPDTGSVVGDIEVACAVFAAAERLARVRYAVVGLSDSSGLLVPTDSVAQLQLAEEAIESAGHEADCRLGVDVAAEHLREPSGRYRLAGRTYPVEEFAAVLTGLVTEHRLGYLEDPFDAADEIAWRRLRTTLPGDTVLVGDDLFATSADRLDPGLAGGVLLKLTQAGTLTATLDVGVAARSMGLLLAGSHRSGETDDTAVVDVAAALGADLVKVGGPRRGDRLGNYNQLLRLSDQLAPTTPSIKEPTSCR